MNIKVSYGWLIAFIAVFWAILATKSCSNKSSQIGEYISFNKSLNDSVKYMKSKDGQITAYKQQISVDKTVLDAIVKEKTALKKTLDDMKVKIKNVQSITEIETHTQLIYDTIKLHDTIKKDELSFIDSNKNYKIRGFVNPSQIIFTDIDFPDSITVTSEYKGGFFRKGQYIVKVSHTNNFVKTTGLESIILKSEKKWYQTGLFKFGLGVISGAIIVKELKL